MVECTLRSLCLSHIETLCELRVGMTHEPLGAQQVFGVGGCLCPDIPFREALLKARLSEYASHKAAPDRQEPIRAVTFR